MQPSSQNDVKFEIDDLMIDDLEFTVAPAGTIPSNTIINVMHDGISVMVTQFG